MRMSLVLRAVATSWVFVLANATVALFLTPYILHRLGDEAFGLWVLVVTLTGYYGFLDAGFRSSILRYVSRHKALGEKESVNEIVATGFYFYLAACTVIILVTYCSVDWVSRLLVPQDELPELFSAFKSLFLLAGVVQGVTLPLLAFAGVLEAAGRYDQVYGIGVACLAIRVIVLIGVLHAGGGLFGVGAATILSQLLAYCLQVPLAMRAHRELSLRPKWVRKSAFWAMLGYGSISTTVGIAEKMRANIYPVVIAAFMTPAAVTLFSLPMKILIVPTEWIATMTAIVNPLSSQLDSRNDFAKLRELIQLSVQSAFLLVVPLAAFLFAFGRELLTLWVGKEYVSAYPLLVLLTLGMGAAATQFCIQSMLFGIERHKQLIWYRFGEGLSITILGSVALRIGGLVGFAWVIAMTLLVTSLILVPRHLCRILDLPLRTYWMEGCLKPSVAALPAATAFMVLHSLFVIDTWAVLVVVFLVGSLVHALTLLLMMVYRSNAISHRMIPRILLPGAFRSGVSEIDS